MTEILRIEESISESLHVFETQVLVHEEILKGIVYDTRLKWRLVSEDGSFQENASFKITSKEHAQATIRQLQALVEYMEKGQ